MNKTQIREALELRKSNKINSVKEAELQAQSSLLKKEVEDNFGTLLTDIDETLSAFSLKAKLSKLVETLKTDVENTDGFKFYNSYCADTFIDFIEYGFTDSIELSYRNEKSKKLSEERKWLIREIEQEYSKLDRMLVKMNANQFYEYLLSIGLNLEIKEVEKPQLPSVEINTKLL